MFFRGRSRAILAVISSQFRVIRLFIRICLAFCRNISRWKVDLPWFQWWQKALSRSAHPKRQQEERYWLESELYDRQLRVSDARFGGSKIQQGLPSSLVTYYAPRLLPAYRSPTKMDIDVSPYCLPAKKFCKWHRMVFSGPVSPIPSRK